MRADQDRRRRTFAIFDIAADAARSPARMSAAAAARAAAAAAAAAKRLGVRDEALWRRMVLGRRV